mmetsp:Transcript_43521/g.92535  ORF Transcript_43521/g.92535 Transcript_43521/m.92535 type:complete len:81 (-) Transcript_43521:30-272(-)
MLWAKNLERENNDGRRTVKIWPLLSYKRSLRRGHRVEDDFAVEAKKMLELAFIRLQEEEWKKEIGILRRPLCAIFCVRSR